MADIASEYTLQPGIAKMLRSRARTLLKQGYEELYQVPCLGTNVWCLAVLHSGLWLLRRNLPAQRDGHPTALLCRAL